MPYDGRPRSLEETETMTTRADIAVRAREDVYPTRTGESSSTRERVDPVFWGRGGDGPMSARDIEGYTRAGFHAVPSVLGADDVERCLSEMRRLADDLRLRGDPRIVQEPRSADVQSVYDVHKLSGFVRAIVARESVAGVARQILGSDVYVHQSRINYKAGFGSGPFYWHSDFEVWHAEDGMARPRACSVSIALTDNLGANGGLMIMPGSQTTFVGTPGESGGVASTERSSGDEPPRGDRPAVGVPDRAVLTKLARECGIHVVVGPAGSGVFFDCNCMHGSNGNITPFARSNLFVVFNSVENVISTPYSTGAPRAEFYGSRDHEILGGGLTGREAGDRA